MLLSSDPVASFRFQKSAPAVSWDLFPWTSHPLNKIVGDIISPSSLSSRAAEQRCTRQSCKNSFCIASTTRGMAPDCRTRSQKSAPCDHLKAQQHFAFVMKGVMTCAMCDRNCGLPHRLLRAQHACCIMRLCLKCLRMAVSRSAMPFPSARTISQIPMA